MIKIIRKIYTKIYRLTHFLFSRVVLGRKSLQVFTDQHPGVFVLSTGRVGTETLAALFSLAPNVFSYHEPDPRLYSLSKFAYQHQIDIDAHKKILDELKLARKDLFQYSLNCRQGYVETSPQVTFLAPFIRELIPNARFIHVIRNPQSVVRSGMRRKWFAGHIADKTRITPSTDSEAGQHWDQYSLLQKNIWLWAETNRWIKQFCSTIPAGNVLFLHSEDIFEAKPETIKMIYDFIGSTVPDAQKLSSLLDKKLNAQRSGEFPLASGWSDAMKKDLIEIAGETAQSFGYHIVSDEF